MRALLPQLIGISCLLFSTIASAANGDFTISSDNPNEPEVLRKWHNIIFTLEGPEASELGEPNPFMDYRFDVTFTQGSKTYIVPGYFAADGDAANTSATSGNKWRAHFAPDSIGTWNYSISFREGPGVAVADDFASVSDPLAPYDGTTGSFNVVASDKTGADLRAKGRLQYVGKHHLQFSETGEYFLKQGADSPENLLHYDEFDDFTNTNGIFNKKYLKNWLPHVQDWQPGDPTWQGTKGRGIIGAINYLASEGMNSISFLTMNLKGDDRNVFPYVSIDARKTGSNPENDLLGEGAPKRLRFDCSKLDQWGIVLSHATSKGLHLHFKLSETENERLLDNGDLLDQRKVYYRELIARFSHNLALNWNLGEENGHKHGNKWWANAQTDAQRRAMTEYFYENDPYRHPVVVHTVSNATKKDQIYTPLLGLPRTEIEDGQEIELGSYLTGASHQTLLAVNTGGEWITDLNVIFNHTKEWVDKSAESGRPWVVATDEPGLVDAVGLLGDDDPNNNHEEARKYALWAQLMAGGAGNEWYFGFANNGFNENINDLTAQDYRTRDQWWDYARYALEFFHNNDIPFWNMRNCELSSNVESWCLSQEGQVYVVYLQNGGTTDLDLTGQGGELFDVRWYNPRAGGALISSDITQVLGGSVTNLGNPPSSADSDWVIFVQAQTATLYSLEVLNGVGDGQYTVSEVVSIQADEPGPDEVFEQWTGDTASITDVESPSTTLIMPAGNVVISASYETVVVDPPWSIGINAGGSAFEASDGLRYENENAFSMFGSYRKGRIYTVNEEIAGTDDDDLYRSQRWRAKNFAYKLPIDNGQYKVTLKFAETYVNASGERLFSVTLEDQVCEKLSGVDIYDRAGGKFIAHDEVVPVTVADGVLKIKFIKGSIQNPFVSGIRIDRVTDSNEWSALSCSP